MIVLIRSIAFILFVLLFACCSNEKDVAGGITDIDHSITIAGTVLDADGKTIASARVVAYIDRNIVVEDSVETLSDEKGNYELELNSAFAKDSVTLFAQTGNLCGMKNFGTSQNYDLRVSSAKKINGKFDGASTGFVRIKGTALKADVQEDGTFVFENAPSGENLVFQYVAGDSAIASFTATVADSADTVELPAFTEIYLNMDSGETVYDNDSTLAENVTYVEGISGNGIALSPGQFIQLDVDPTDGDFTISLWTKWFGPNGNHQILVAQRSYWSDSTSKFQWHFEGGEEKFYVMKSAPVMPEKIYFGDALVLPVDEWCFVALVSRNGLISMFVNGTQVGETQAFVPNSLDVTVPFRIGGDEIDTETWNGIIDEVRVESFARNF